MATHARGLICLTLTPERCDELELRHDGRPTTGRRTGPPSPSRSRPARASPPASPPPTARTPSASPSTGRKGAHDLVQPGHVFPLRARRAACSSAPARPRPPSTSPASPAAAGRRDLRGHERGRHDGARARPRRASAREHGLKMITVADLIAYRRRSEKLVERMAAAQLPTALRRLRGDRLPLADRRQAAPGAGLRRRRRPADDVLVRVHSECVTGDVFHSLRCDCGEQLDQALRADRQPRAAACCCTWPRRAAASACSTSCAPTSCRSRAATPSRPTPRSASRPTCATTASARRSSPTSA